MYKAEPYVGLASSFIIGYLALVQGFHGDVQWAIIFAVISLFCALKVFWSMIDIINVTMESECDQHESF